MADRGLADRVERCGESHDVTMRGAHLGKL